ncbi:hypothetical protein [Microseira wollei]|uniref:hypothetical protein n=1 Tax=Microseira wollei TaxID=467598 RepID=UPI001CFF393F|nr:hypothetical protein [Microseira wollei]
MGRVYLSYMMSVKSPLIKTQIVTAFLCHRVSPNYGYSSGHDIICCSQRRSVKPAPTEIYKELPNYQLAISN